MFWSRTLSSTALISLFFISILWNSIYSYFLFIAFTVCLAFLCVYEFLQILSKTGRKSYPLFTGIAGSVTVVFTATGQANQFAGLIIFVIICWLILLFSGKKQVILEKVLNSIAGLALVIIPLSYLILIYSGQKFGRSLILYLVLVTKFGDIGAYSVGTLTNKLMKGGNHKIVPVISPKKSWEGTIGGLSASVLCSIIIWNFSGLGNSVSFIFAFLVGILLFVGGFVGDLAESSFKRITMIKDSGAVIPGIGGVLDLLDSLLINSPLFYFIVNYYGLLS